MVLRILFLSFSNADIKFIESEKCIWRCYDTIEALLISNRVRFINKKDFAKVILDENSEIFVVYVTILEVLTAILIYLSKTSQVPGSDKPLLLVLLCNKDYHKIPAKNIDYTNVFSLDLILKLLENTDINNHTIKRVEGKPLPYIHIYYLSR